MYLIFRNKWYYSRCISFHPSIYIIIIITFNHQPSILLKNPVTTSAKASGCSTIGK